MASKSPAFQFYPKDFLGSMSVSLMSAEQIGAYVLLLCYNWNNGGIPKNRVAIATLCRLPLATLNEWGKSDKENPVISRFVEDKSTGLLVNERLERERASQIERREKAANSGRKGAARRWDGHKKSKNSNPNGNPNGVAIDSPMAFDGSSSSSSIALEKKKNKKKDFLFPSEKFGKKFAEAWAEWLEHRKTLKKPKNWNFFFQRQFKKLHDYSEANAVAMLEAATLNGYIGLAWDRYPTGDQPAAKQATKPEQPKTVWQINQQIEATEEQMKDIRETHFFNHAWSDIEKQKQWKTLKDHLEILKFQRTGVTA
tara:strand:+ start:1854 stop:2789 length:936 start_codon:yes stop_codon:yes gene_type:complete